MFRVTKNEASNKTIRMPDPLIARLETLARENGISFNKVVVQCCEYALTCLPRNKSEGEVHSQIEDGQHPQPQSGQGVQPQGGQRSQKAGGQKDTKYD